MRVLITSFDTWKYHQRHNSSDVLLQALRRDYPGFVTARCHVLRRLPVDARTAARRILEAVRCRRPGGVVLCGMGRSRRWLKVEAGAGMGGKHLRRRADPAPLVAGLPSARISHFAGRFVCNETYYRVLRTLQRRGLKAHCLFIHVPQLNAGNTKRLTWEFHEILRRFARSIEA